MSLEHNIHYAKVINGELIYSNKKAIHDHLMAIEGKDVWIKISRTTGVRSDLQNSYLWGVVYRIIADETGHTQNEIHDIMKRKFLPPTFVEWKGQQIKMPNSTAKLSKPDFSEYIDRIQAEVADLGVIIPPAES